MAEVLFADELERRGVDATVHSAGLLDDGRPASPDSASAHGRPRPRPLGPCQPNHDPGDARGGRPDHRHGTASRPGGGGGGPLGLASGLHPARAGPSGARGRPPPARGRPGRLAGRPRARGARPPSTWAIHPPTTWPTPSAAASAPIASAPTSSTSSSAWWSSTCGRSPSPEPTMPSGAPPHDLDRQPRHRAVRPPRSGARAPEHDPAAHRLGELHLARRHGGDGLGADQQVQRGLPVASATTAATR